MEIRATVLIPTHDHGPTLLRAARSALAQTVHEIELFIIGDGVSSEGRQIGEALQQSDPRVRFFDYPKGPRHGERYRHGVLLDHARGAIVCYLSDDDLWLSHHVETMERLLADADVAHTLSVKVEPDGTLDAGNDLDFRVPGLLQAVAAGTLGGTGLSCLAHTLDFYRRLAVGWDTTPQGIATDTQMVRTLVSHPGCRAVSGTRPTVLRFASKRRRDWSADRRAAELDGWAVRIANPTWLARFPDDVLDSVVRADAGKRFKLDVQRRKRRDLAAQIEELKAVVAALRATCTDLKAERDRALAEAHVSTTEARAAAAQLSRALKRKTADCERLRAECRRLETTAKRLRARLARAKKAGKTREAATQKAADSTSIQ